MNEPHRSVSVDQINWGEVLLITRLGRALSLSLQPNRIIMGFVLVAVLMATGTLWDALFGARVGPAGLGSAPLSDAALDERLRPLLRDESLFSEDRAAALGAEESLRPAAVRDAIEGSYRARPAEERAEYRGAVEAALMQVRLAEPMGVFEATARAVIERTRDILSAALALNGGLVFSSVAQLLEIPSILFGEHTGFAVVYGVWSLVVLLIGSAAISRSAACQFAIEQYIPWTTSLAFALKRWVAILGAPGLPLAGLAIGAAGLAVGGLLLAVPGLNVLGAALYGVALIGSAVAACLIVLTVLASALLVPAVAVDAADAPDALARAYSFVRNRPLHWLAYALTAFVQGLLGLLLVALIAAIAINFAAWGAGLIVTPPAVEALGGGAAVTQLMPEDRAWMLTGTHRAAGAIIGLWRTVVAGFVAGWVLSYFSCASTVLYFLMRKATDDQDLEEIWQPGVIEGTMAPGRAAVDEDQESP